MKIIGLTGGISTGKSTISNYISSLNISVLDADVIARGSFLGLSNLMVHRYRCARFGGFSFDC